LTESSFPLSLVDIDEILGGDTPLALKSFGSHDERRSAIAAFKNLFFAVLPENSNLGGLLKAEASEDSGWCLVGAIFVSVL
jgi:hypothetical protein